MASDRFLWDQIRFLFIRFVRRSAQITVSSVEVPVTFCVIAAKMSSSSELAVKRETRDNQSKIAETKDDCNKPMSKAESKEQDPLQAMKDYLIKIGKWSGGSPLPRVKSDSPGAEKRSRSRSPPKSRLVASTCVEECIQDVDEAISHTELVLE